MTSEIKMCIDKFVPEGKRQEAARRALAERPDNLVLEPLPAGPNPQRLALRIDTKWEPGRELRVRFLDGNTLVQKKVEALAHAWSDHGNIRLVFGDDPDAEIRISFQHEGSWSYLGNVALQIAQDEPTMNYGWLTPDSDDQEYSRVVIHEFGHALGAIHEHQSPDAQIPWDKEAVYAYYARHGWSREQVDHNLFVRYSPEGIANSRFDRESIMLYAIDNALTVGDWEVGWNTDLSDLDRTFIAREYPGEAKRENELVVDGDAVEDSIGTHGELDRFSFVVEQAGPYVVETHGHTDVVMALLGPDDETTLVAFDDDSGVGFNARIEHQLATGRYHVHIRHFRPSGTGAYAVSVHRP